MELQAWRGHVYPGTVGCNGIPVVVQHYDHLQAVRYVIEWDAMTAHKVGIGPSIPRPRGLPDRIGVWELDDLAGVEIVDIPEEAIVHALPVHTHVPFTSPDLVGFCHCECGGETKARFQPGHDAKLKGRLIRAAKSTGTLDPPWQGESDPWKVAKQFGWTDKLPNRPA